MNREQEKVHGFDTALSKSEWPSCPVPNCHPWCKGNFSQILRVLRFDCVGLLVKILFSTYAAANTNVCCSLGADFVTMRVSSAEATIFCFRIGASGCQCCFTGLYLSVNCDDRLVLFPYFQNVWPLSGDRVLRN